MKTISATVIFFMTVTVMLGQLSNYDLMEIKTMNIECSKKMLVKRCSKDRSAKKFAHKRKQFGLIEVDSFNYIPISLLHLKRDAIDYNSSLSIVDFLEYRKKHSLFGFYTFKNNELYGLMDLTDELSFSLQKDCTYWTIDNSYSTKKNPLYLGFSYLESNKRDTSFLFNVKYFVNTLWFVENSIVYVLDLNQMKVFEPDEFIQMSCYEGFVQDIAKGGNVTCNY